MGTPYLPIATHDVACSDVECGCDTKTVTACSNEVVAPCYMVRHSVWHMQQCGCNITKGWHAAMRSQHHATWFAHNVASAAT
eukprot:1137446-Pelagomonas_calceolata.AAC.16